MQKGYSPSDYLYASARIRALEARLATKEQLAALTDGGDPAEVIAALADAAGVTLTRELGDTEAALVAILKGGMATVRASVPDGGIVRSVALPYDCHNAKAYLKCHILGIDPTPLLIDAGTVPVKELLTALKENNTALLPTHLAEAFGAASDAYAKTADPREIDFLLDRALYLDLAEALVDLPFAAEWLKAKTDLLNILICLRLLRGNKEIAKALFSKSMLPGGTLNESFFAPFFSEGEGLLISTVSAQTPYGKVVQGAEKCALSELEKRADDELTRHLADAKRLSFGAEIPFAYLMALDGIVKNLRIVLGGRAAGLDRATLRSRVRENYV